MSLTRKECEKAFKRLNGLILSSPFEGDLTDYNDLKKCGTQLQDNFMDDVIVFSQLIDEHFDNPPLKFEDLKVNMWVWDINTKKYRKIFYVDTETKKIVFCGQKLQVNYKKGRFYEREVKEDE